MFCGGKWIEMGELTMDKLKYRRGRKVYANNALDSRGMEMIGNTGNTK